MARSRVRSSGTTPEQEVERLLSRTQPGQQEHDSRILRFNRAYQVWRGQPMGSPPSSSAARDWRHKMRPKYGMQIIDQAQANLAEGVPSVRVLPRRSGDEAGAEALEQILSYFADRDHLAEKEIAVTQTALIYGVSPAKNEWCYYERGGQVVDDRPTFTPWDPYQCWWDPYARDVDSAAYIVLRTYLTKAELETRRYDEQTGAGFFRNLELLYQSGEPEKPATTAQNQLLMPPPGVLRDRFEVLEFWHEEPDGLHLSVVGNRKVLLRSGLSPFKMTGKPITISNSRPDLFKIEGVSEAELVDNLQEALWKVGNLRLDQMMMTVLRGATVRETAPDIRQLVFRPGFLWPVQDHDDVRMVEPAPLPPEAYKEDEALLGRLQYITGITPYVSGASATTGGVDQGTATGTTLLTQSASKLLQLKGQIIHNRTWQRTFEQWAALCRQFLSDQTEVRIVGPGEKFSWATYQRGDINADYDVKIEAGDKSASVQQARAEMIQLLQVMTPFVQEGIVDVNPILRKVAKSFGFVNPDALLPPPKPAPPQAAPGPPPGANGSWAQPGQPPELQAGQIVPHPMASVIHGHRR